MHTICTQFAHTNTHRDTETETHKQNNMQHTEQDNTEQENREQYTQDNAQPQHRCTDNLHTYSFDLYHEQIYIKNSNTIELYTISKENI